MSLGLVEERVYQMMLHEHDAHAAWVNAKGWQYQMPPRRTWRQSVAAALMALATRIAPAVALPHPGPPALAQ